VKVRRLYRVATRRARQILACLLMISFSGGVTGIPVVESNGKDRSHPFPCQDNPCGCSSAEECWHHCCCHNNREKVAWANAHGVIPPTFVVEAAEKEDASAEQVCEHHAGCPSCAAKSHAAHSSPTVACGSGSCCSHKHESSVAAPAPAAKKQVRVRLVLSDLARHCRGLPQLWTLLSQVLPAPISPAWSPDLSLVEVVEELSFSRPWIVLSPPVRPPEGCALRG
jgi:hypothetical protein